MVSVVEHFHTVDLLLSPYQTVMTHWDTVQQSEETLMVLCVTREVFLLWRVKLWSGKKVN